MPRKLAREGGTEVLFDFSHDSKGSTEVIPGGCPGCFTPDHLIPGSFHSKPLLGTAEVFE